MRFAAAALFFTLAGCALSTWAMEDVQFRSKEPDTAFERAVKAVEDDCWGVKVANPEVQLVQSKWQSWPTGDGIYLSRCLVSIVSLPDEKASEVRVAFAMKQCPLADLDDLEALSEICTFTNIVPAIVADQLSAAGKKIEAGVRR